MIKYDYTQIFFFSRFYTLTKYWQERYSYCIHHLFSPSHPSVKMLSRPILRICTWQLLHIFSMCRINDIHVAVHKVPGHMMLSIRDMCWNGILASYSQWWFFYQFTIYFTMFSGLIFVNLSGLLLNHDDLGCVMQKHSDSRTTLKCSKLLCWIISFFKMYCNLGITMRQSCYPCSYCVGIVGFSNLIH